MASPVGPPKGVRRPSNAAYYVALVGVLALLLLLCLYFFYYFIKKVKELSSAESLSLPGASCRSPTAATAYPVQPVVRDSATAMAKLCRAVPAGGKGDTVFPTSTSPEALRTDTGPAGPPAPVAGGPDTEPAGPDQPPEPARPDKPPPPPPATVAVPVDVAARRVVYTTSININAHYCAPPS